MSAARVSSPSAPARGRTPHAACVTQCGGMFDFGWRPAKSRGSSPHLVADRITRQLPLAADRCDAAAVVPRISQPYLTSFSAVLTPRRVGGGGGAGGGGARKAASQPSLRGAMARSCDALESGRRRADPLRSRASDRGTSLSRSADRLLSTESDDGASCRASRDASPRDASPRDASPHVPLTANHSAGSVTKNVIHREYVHIIRGDAVDDDRPAGGATANGRPVDDRRSGSSPADARSRGSPERSALGAGFTSFLRRVTRLSPKSFRKLSPARRSDSRSRHRGASRERAPTTSDDGSPPEGNKGNKPKSTKSKSQKSTPTKSAKATDCASPPKSTESTPTKQTGKSATKLTPKATTKSTSPIKRLFRGSPPKQKAGGANDGVTKGRAGDAVTKGGASDGVTDVAAASALPAGSARILRRIGNSSGGDDRDVYHAFKDRQAGRTAAAAAVPSPVRAAAHQRHLAAELELLDGLVPPPRTLSGEQRAFADAGERRIFPDENTPVGRPNGIVADGQEAEVPASRSAGGGEQRLCPPQTLDVRSSVSKASRGSGRTAYSFSSVSADSIGQCSLDVYATGSEPSIARDTDSHQCAPLSCTASPTQGLGAGVGAGEKPPGGQGRVPLADLHTNSNGCVGVENDVSRVVGGGGERASQNGIQNGRRPTVAQKPSLRKTSSSTTVSTRSATVVNGTCDASGDARTDSGAALARGPCDAGPPGADERDAARPVAPPDETEARNAVDRSQACTAGGAAIGDDGGDTSLNKDGAYFLVAVQREHDRLDALCQTVSRDLENAQLPDEVEGKMRAAVGKAQLLTTKKFKQFRGLCQQEMDQTEGDRFQTTAQDLAGFWDMVLLQIGEVVAMFGELDALRRNDWKPPGGATENPPSSVVDGTTASLKSTTKSTGAKGSGVKGSGAKGSRPPRDAAKTDEATRARNEARRRLLAAKRAGRQRKASQSDQDVEIYVS